MIRRIASSLLFVLAACSAPGAAPDLRAAVDRAEVSLTEVVSRGESNVHGTGIEARIVPHADQFAVAAVAVGVRHRLLLDFRGEVTSAVVAEQVGRGCRTQITLAEALAVAEGAAGGDAVAVAVVPDDDDPCMREVQVLAGATLYEVKVGPDGAVVEQELSDEEL